MKDKHKDDRKYCKKCGTVLGENVDGKPICFCEVWPCLDEDWVKHNEIKLGNTTNVKVRPLAPEGQREFGGCG